MHFAFLGKLGDNFVLGKFSDDGKRYELSLRDSSNHVISNSSVDRKFLGETLLGDLNYVLPEHLIVRNKKLFAFYREKRMAKITEVDLQILFGRQ